MYYGHKRIFCFLSPFANTVDTRTRGLDLVARYASELGRRNVHASVAATCNEISLRSLQVYKVLQGIQTDSQVGNDF